jgi:hypothetical protein
MTNNGHRRMSIFTERGLTGAEQTDQADARAALERELDDLIAQDLVLLEGHVRHDLIVSASPDAPPSPASIEMNVAAVLEEERALLRAWRARVLTIHALELRMPSSRPS